MTGSWWRYMKCMTMCQAGCQQSTGREDDRDRGLWHEGLCLAMKGTSLSVQQQGPPASVGCGISGIISQIHSQIKHTPQRQKARRRGQACWPWASILQITLSLFYTNVLLLPRSLALHLWDTFLHFPSFPFPPTHSCFPLHLTHSTLLSTHTHAACCLQPEESGNQRQWSVSTKEQCARGCVVRLAKEIRGNSIITDQHRRKKKDARQYRRTESLSLFHKTLWSQMWHSLQKSPLWEKETGVSVTLLQ